MPNKAIKLCRRENPAKGSFEEASNSGKVDMPEEESDIDVDIFGSTLKISAEEKALVTDNGLICLKKKLLVEGKKESELRTVIVTNSTCYVLMHGKGGLKIETSFHFLKIIKITSSEEKSVAFHLVGEAKPREYKAENDDFILDIVTAIVGHLKNTLSLTPYQKLVKVSMEPKQRQNKVDEGSTRLTENMTSPDSHSVNGFVTVYAFQCNYYGIPVSEDTAWNISEIYLSHGFRILKLNDFEQNNQKVLLPLVSALEHNEYFEGVEEKDNELSSDVLTALAGVLQNQHRHGFKTLILSYAGLKSASVVKLLNAVKANPKSALSHLDLSGNRLDDHCLEALCQMCSSLSHGLTTLKLSNCGITLKGAAMLASSLKENKHMTTSLSHLDLSGNTLGPDSQASLSFLAEPNAVATLGLSKTSITYDLLFPALFRGCTQSLVTLDISDNKTPKKSKAGPPPLQKIQQFFASVVALKEANMGNTSTTSDVAKVILEGLKDNPHLSQIKLSLSQAELSHGSLKPVAAVLAEVSCVHELDISHNGIDASIPSLISALGTSSVRRLHIGGNFGKSKNVQEILTSLCSMLNSRSCKLECLQLTNSKLKEHTISILEALLGNKSLVEIDISGNDMGDRGARALSRALMVSLKLRIVHWDDNGTTLEGFKSVAYALKYNHTLRSMPTPLRDALKVSRTSKGTELETVLQEIQNYLYRNHSPERLTVESEARRKRQILLLTSQQQEMDQNIVDLDDIVKAVPKNSDTNPLIEEAEKSKIEANKVMQIASQLYSEEAESKQTDSIIAQLRSVTGTLQARLFEEQVQDNSERMVSETVKAFPLLLQTTDSQRKFERLVVKEMPEGFLEAEIVNRAGPEVANKISQKNLEVSIAITKLLVEATLNVLSGHIKQLQPHMPAPTPEVDRKSEGGSSAKTKKRHFSFSAQVKPAKFASKYQPQEDLDFGVVEKQQDGPKLEHLTKSRPKPARARKGSYKPSSLGVEDTDSNKSKEKVQEVKEQPKLETKPKKEPLQLPKKARAVGDNQKEAEEDQIKAEAVPIKEAEKEPESTELEREEQEKKEVEKKEAEKEAEKKEVEKESDEEEFEEESQNESVEEPKEEPKKEPEEELERELEMEPEKESGKELQEVEEDLERVIKELDMDTENDSVKEPEKEPVKQHIKEPDAKELLDKKTEDEQEPAKVTEKEPAKVTEKEPKREPEKSQEISNKIEQEKEEEPKVVALEQEKADKEEPRSESQSSSESPLVSPKSPSKSPSAVTPESGKSLSEQGKRKSGLFSKFSSKKKKEKESKKEKVEKDISGSVEPTADTTPVTEPVKQKSPEREITKKPASVRHPTGGVGFGSEVMSQMKRRQTYDSMEEKVSDGNAAATESAGRNSPKKVPLLLPKPKSKKGEEKTEDKEKKASNSSTEQLEESSGSRECVGKEGSAEKSVSPNPAVSPKPSKAKVPPPALKPKPKSSIQDGEPVKSSPPLAVKPIKDAIVEEQKSPKKVPPPSVKPKPKAREAAKDDSPPETRQAAASTSEKQNLPSKELQEDSKVDNQLSEKEASTAKNGSKNGSPDTNKKVNSSSDGVSSTKEGTEDSKL